MLAAAIHAKADVILTLNTRDFPKATLAPHGIVARRPDDLIADLFDRHPRVICEVARAQRNALVAPAQSVDEFLDTLRMVGLRKTTSRLRSSRDDL